MYRIYTIYLINLIITYFIVDHFENEVPHLLDIKISPIVKTTPTLGNMLTVKVILFGITESAGFEVLLQKQNGFVVQITVSRNSQNNFASWNGFPKLQAQ